MQKVKDAYHRKGDFLRKLELENETLKAMVYGSVPPNAVKLEEAVLGAVISDADAYHVINFLTTENFYLYAHQLIFAAILRLIEKRAPVDLLMVKQELFEQLHSKGEAGTQLEEIGNVTYLADLTSRIGSSANIEYHARIIQQTFYQREMIKTCADTIHAITHKKEDIFTVYDRMQVKTFIPSNNKMFIMKSMNEVVREGLRADERIYIFGKYIALNQCTIIFGPPGGNKSTFATQLGDAVSGGKSFFNFQPNQFQIDSLFSNRSKNPIKVGIIDFEMEAQDVADRSINKETGLIYEYNNDNFQRFELNKDFDDVDNEKKRFQEIEQLINIHKFQLLIVDNITWMMQDASDATLASKFMKILKQIKRRHNIGIIVLAHTQKSYKPSEPIELASILGSGVLGNFAEVVLAIGKSKKDNNTRYIKQLKGRQNEIDSNKVIECVITTNEAGFLHFEFEKFSLESDHLTMPDEPRTDEELMKLIYDLHLIGKGSRTIIKELDIRNMSHTTVGNRIKQYKAQLEAPLEEDWLEGLSPNNN